MAPRVYSYIVKNDTGFSPNPFHGICTLACCKPKIRASARVGDLIIGMTSRGEHLVYAMQVSRVVTFADYWTDAQYAAKRPIWDSARAIDKSGDNIYEPVAIGKFQQLRSFHSNPDGTVNRKKMAKDLGGDHVLVADAFTYCGKDGPAMPRKLRFLGVGRGHRCRFEPEQVEMVARWFAEKLPRGKLGRPALWASDDADCERR